MLTLCDIWISLILKVLLFKGTWSRKRSGSGSISRRFLRDLPLRIPRNKRTRSFRTTFKLYKKRCKFSRAGYFNQRRRQRRGVPQVTTSAALAPPANYKYTR